MEQIKSVYEYKGYKITIEKVTNDNEFEIKITKGYKPAGCFYYNFDSFKDAEEKAKEKIDNKVVNPEFKVDDILKSRFNGYAKVVSVDKESEKYVIKVLNNIQCGKIPIEQVDKKWEKVGELNE